MPAAVQSAATRLVRSTGVLTAGPAQWVPAAVLAGLLPLALAHVARLPLSQGTTAVLLALLLLPAAAEGRTARGLATIGLVFATHSGLAILLSVWDASAHAALPGAADYWEQTRQWIITGQNTEYEPSVWLPIHLGTLGGVAVSSYLSMGVIAFWQGFEQVDMMNFYVGRLLAESKVSPTLLLLAWHPWSICRGIGMALISFEILSVSLQRFAGMPAAGATGRAARCLTGVGFLLLDAALKLTILDFVRQRLADHFA